MNRPKKRFAILFLAAAAALFIGNQSASACTGGIFRFEEVFSDADVVLRAVVTDIRDSSLILGPMPSDKVARLEVSEVWKGRPRGAATLHYTEQNTACGVTLQVGESITLFAAQDRQGRLYAGWPQIAEHSNFSVSSAFLADYRRLTDALRSASLNGGEPEAIAFAHHLTRWNASAEAFAVYQEMIDRYDHDAEAYLGLAIAQYSLRDSDSANRSIESAIKLDPSLGAIDQVHPSMLGEFHRRVARARFVLIGQIDPFWNDLSGLKPGTDCASPGRLDGTDFTRSNLSNCRFDGARLKAVTFTDADLTSASFHATWLEDVDFSGANLSRASFVGTLISIGDLVGTRDKKPAINFLEASYDKATLACTLEDANYFKTSFNSGMRRLWLPKLRKEQAALRSIIEKWPTAKLNRSCQSLLELDLQDQ